MTYDLRSIRPRRIGIEFEDKTRHILFDMNAMAELEEMYGSYGEALEALNSGSFRAMRALLYCGLLHEDPEMTLQKAGTLVAMSQMDVLSDALVAAMQDAVPTKKQEKTSEQEDEKQEEASEQENEKQDF